MSLSKEMNAAAEEKWLRSAEARQTKNIPLEDARAYIFIKAGSSQLLSLPVETDTKPLIAEAQKWLSAPERKNSPTGYDVSFMAPLGSDFTYASMVWNVADALDALRNILKDKEVVTLLANPPAPII